MNFGFKKFENFGSRIWTQNHNDKEIKIGDVQNLIMFDHFNSDIPVEILMRYSKLHYQDLFLRFRSQQ